MALNYILQSTNRYWIQFSFNRTSFSNLLKVRPRDPKVNFVGIVGAKFLQARCPSYHQSTESFNRTATKFSFL